jgi:hypothetical protein
MMRLSCLQRLGARSASSAERRLIFDISVPTPMPSRPDAVPDALQLARQAEFARTAPYVQQQASYRIDAIAANPNFQTASYSAESCNCARSEGFNYGRSYTLYNRPPVYGYPQNPAVTRYPNYAYGGVSVPRVDPYRPGVVGPVPCMNGCYGYNGNIRPAALNSRYCGRVSGTYMFDNWGNMSVVRTSSVATDEIDLSNGDSGAAIYRDSAITPSGDGALTYGGRPAPSVPVTPAPSDIRSGYGEVSRDSLDSYLTPSLSRSRFLEVQTLVGDLRVNYARWRQINDTMKINALPNTIADIEKVQRQLEAVDGIMTDNAGRTAHREMVPPNSGQITVQKVENGTLVPGGLVVNPTGARLFWNDESAISFAIQESIGVKRYFPLTTYPTELHFYKPGTYEIGYGNGTVRRRVTVGAASAPPPERRSDSAPDILTPEAGKRRFSEILTASKRDGSVLSEPQVTELRVIIVRLETQLKADLALLVDFTNLLTTNKIAQNQAVIDDLLVRLSRLRP